MWDQEKEHLRLFSNLIVERRARPTALLPIWNVAGYALGIYFLRLHCVMLIVQTYIYVYRFSYTHTKALVLLLYPL